MPFERPTLAQLQSSVKADIETRLETGALLKRSFLYVFSQVIAGSVHLLYGFLDWIYRQLFLHTAEAEAVVREASLYGLSRAAATFASGSAEFSGVNGTVISSGLTLKRSDGLQFVTTESATISGGKARVTLRSLNAGSRANTESGVSLSLIQSISGLEPQAKISGDGLSGARDIETVESLRSRLQARKSAPPHGGALQDYKAWATSVNGISRAYPIANGSGAGTVDLILVDDSKSPPVPDDSTVDSAQAYLEEVRPVTADVRCVGVVAQAVNLTIALTPDTAETRAAVMENIQDLFLRESEPSKPMLISKIREAVSTAAGENDSQIIQPTTDTAPSDRNMLVLGAITWQ